MVLFTSSTVLKLALMRGTLFVVVFVIVSVLVHVAFFNEYARRRKTKVLICGRGEATIRVDIDNIWRLLVYSYRRYHFLVVETPLSQVPESFPYGDCK